MVEVPLSEDAAVVLGIAGTAMPFSDSTQSQVEHWVRILRMHGEVGEAMQAVGVGETPLGGAGRRPSRAGARVTLPADSVVDLVTAHAVKRATRRGAAAVSTSDVLYAVMHLYGELFEDGLRSRGVTGGELLERLETGDTLADRALKPSS
jgi:hypothetical protein